MKNIFTVEKADLERLNSEEAVDFFRELLCAEAHTMGIPTNNINIPLNITAPDGGIDAEVLNSNANNTGQGLIRIGKTCYQIKTGPFDLSKPNRVKEILLKSNGDIKDRIKSCFSDDGTLVVVLFGWDVPDRKDFSDQTEEGSLHIEIIKKFREILNGIDKVYCAAKIEVFTQNQLINFLIPYPSLCSKLNGQKYDFQIHGRWEIEESMEKELIKSPDYDDKLDNLRKLLRSRSDRAEHIRIIGEAGVGKTRFILEATRTDDISPLVIYYGNSEDFIDELLKSLQRNDNRFDVVAVVDECKESDRIYIWNKLANCGPRIKLITIYNEPDESTQQVEYAKLPELTSYEIKKIIESYGPFPEPVDRWAEICGNSPRFAHMVGMNLRINPDDILKPIENVYDRIISGYQKLDTVGLRKRKLIMRCIALFKRFGSGRDFKSESNAVYNIIHQLDQNVSLAEFYEIINWFKKMRLLQGAHTLYITPKILHLQMFREWWEEYGDHYNLEELYNGLSGTPDLQSWFKEMFHFAQNIESCSSAIDEYLSNALPFKNQLLGEEGLSPRFFLALTKANPAAAIKYLKRTIGKASREELLRFEYGRREVVWALEYTAQQRKYFSDSAELLLILAETENENISNNATGIFAALFSLGFGPLSYTEVQPKDRFPVLIKALYSKSPERRRIALEGFKSSLSRYDQVFRLISSNDSISISPNLWKPNDWSELFDSYKLYWSYLVDNLDDFTDDIKKEIIKILLDSSIGVAGISATLTEMVLSTLRVFSKKDYVEKSKLLDLVIRIIHYPGKDFPEDLLAKWKQFERDLTGSGLSDLLRRYVGMDLLDDYFPVNDKYDETVINEKIEQMANEVINNSALLESEYHWLMTDKAKRGSKFGYLLGKLDIDHIILNRMIEEQNRVQKDGSAFVLGGYFKAIYENDIELWKEQISVLIESDSTRELGMELIWRSGMNDWVAEKILNMARRNLIDYEKLTIFIMGGAVRKISESIFLEWIDLFLLRNMDKDILSALDLFSSYHRDNSKEISEDIISKILLHRVFWENPEKISLTNMIIHQWSFIASKYIDYCKVQKQVPATIKSLAKKLIEFFSMKNSIIENSNSEATTVLNRVIEILPRFTWNEIAKEIISSTGTRALHLRSWLRGYIFMKDDVEKDRHIGGALNLFEPSDIWNWVDEEVEDRAPLLASYVPIALFHSQDKVCIAREMLAKYGSIDSVRDRFYSNFLSIGWMGKESEMLERRKADLIYFQSKEQNELVLRWVNECLEALEKNIKRALIEEERED